MQFLSPLMLGGMALVSVPIIIHLLNRRRFRRIEWAPMKYLQLTIKTNRRRLRLEQLLLLLLRMLLIAMLIFAVSRPTITASSEGAGPLASLLAGRSRRAHVLVIDDSLSMGYQTQGRSAFELARQDASRIIEAVGAQDSVTVLVTSDPDQPLVSQAHLRDPLDLLEDIAALKVSHTPSHWQGSFEAVDRHLAEAPFPVRQVTLITDLRRQGWDPGVRQIAERWAQERVSMTIIDVGSAARDNVALIGLEQQTPLALPGIQTHFVAVVRNDGARALSQSQATMSIDDKPRPLRLPELAPGQVGRIPLSITFDKPGEHLLKLSLPADLLPQDDTRYLSVQVKPKLDLLLVDGEPGERPFESETDFLLLAFTVGGAPVQVYRMIDSEWLAGAAREVDLLVLANLATLPPRRVELIRQQVRRGMGLMIFAGEQIDITQYNELLYQGGAGIMPGAIDRVRNEQVTGLLLEPLTASPLDVLSSLSPESLARISARRIMALRIPDQTPDVRVLARWNDADQTPAIVEKRIGAGRVIFWSMTADKHWTQWPIDPTYVLAVREAALRIARGAAPRSGFTAGQAITFQLEEIANPTDARITVPGSDQVMAVQVSKDATDHPLLSYADTQQAGLYSMSWKDSRVGSRVRVFSVNPDPSESDLTPVDRVQLLQWLAALDPVIVGHGDADAALAGTGSEIWRFVITALIGFLIIESLMAAWVGRQR